MRLRSKKNGKVICIKFVDFAPFPFPIYEAKKCPAAELFDSRAKID